MKALTYRDGNSDGRVVVKIGGKVVGFYMKPQNGNHSDTYHLFYNQGEDMAKFSQYGEMEWFILENLAV